jgi:iron complex outermembrane receptor protein
VVIQPSFLPGFSASFDYYKIDISSAIAVVAPQQTINNCFAGNNIYCNNLVFSGTSITTVHSEPGNAAYAHSSGFDIEASYTKRLTEIVDTWDGSVTARVLATHVIDLTTVTPDGTVNQGAGVMTGAMYPLPTAPHWRYNVTVGYDNDTFSTSVTGRGLSSGVQSSQYIQCTSACPNVAAPYFTIDNNHVPGAFYMDLSFTYHLKPEGSFASDLFFTVENVNNWQPNFAFISFAPVMYDTLGRVFRAGVRFKM